MADEEKMTDDEMLRLVNSHVATQNALGDALIILARLEAVTFDPQQKLAIVNERREVENEYASNEQDFLAFCDGKLAMRPPTSEQVNEIVNLAGDLAVLTQKKTTFVAVMKLTVSVLDKVAEIRKGG